MQDFLSSSSSGSNATYDLKEKKLVNTNSNSSGYRKVQCEVCNKNGHSANQCFKLKDLILGRSNGPHALVVETYSYGNNRKSSNVITPWILYSGTSHHLIGGDAIL